MDFKRKKIIIVDDDITNLITSKKALADQFYVLTVPSGEKLLQALDIFMPDLILLDADLPGIDGFETLRRLKTDRQAAEIPIIFLSARDDYASHQLSLNLGAADFVMKPYVPALLVNLIERHLLLSDQYEELKRYEERAEQLAVQRRASILKLQDTLLDTLVALSHNNRCLLTTGSAGRLRNYLSVMIDEMHRRGVYHHEQLQWNQEYFIGSAQLHDIGKIIVRDSILQKPGKLTPEEFESVKNHTVFGVKVIEAIERNTPNSLFFNNAKLFAAAHHERWDGFGYPLGLKEYDIPIQGRLIAIIDVYDALVSDRPYKQPLSHPAAREIILENSGTQFDPLLTDVFLSVSDAFADIRKNCR